MKALWAKDSSQNRNFLFKCARWSYDDNAPRGPVIIGEPPKQTAQTFEAIEHTVRTYTTYTLNAFKQVAIAEVSEVTLKFGVNISSEAGIPYIANAKGGCNMKITVKCEFPKKTEQ